MLMQGPVNLATISSSSGSYAILQLVKDILCCLLQEAEQEDKVKGLLGKIAYPHHGENTWITGALKDLTSSKEHCRLPC